ncbi:insulinoma-associated protein 1a-like [Brienomyrus brachyistius]|uniref:insulinoma-associated protein 1a-like n=1 Tax=Brienomyrus brachyistius TaxID=42636 RepID=UPI0020B28B2E|nr:insulinoma-associated protein 1a-like [Brienomyrus brachyistius]
MPIAAMPKGFLVKRTKKTGSVCYRMREEDRLDQASGSLASPLHYCDGKTERSAVQSLDCNRQSTKLRSPLCFRDITYFVRPPLSSPESPQQSRSGNRFGRTLSSNRPFRAESFPEQQAISFKTCEAPAVFSASLAEMTSKLGTLGSKPVTPQFKRLASPSARLKLVNPKRQTLSPSDETSTSPVFGLRILEDPEVEVKQRSNTSISLGEYICQLCKERYSDPLTLAQHQCSRIVRVEYRCPDCEKVFSCPANLASHRRWHKPKIARGDADKTNLRAVAVQNADIQHPPPSSPKPPDSHPGENTSFNCTLCCKKFRRRSYLRKHLAVHSRRTVLQHSRFSAEENNARISQSAPKHSFNVTPAPLNPRRESPAAIITDSSDTYPCRFCGETFFSSPGLTRHINKCHPAETREVIFLPQRV